MELTRQSIESLKIKTRTGEARWEKSPDQSCCSTIELYSGMDYILCLFNPEEPNEFIVFGELDDSGVIESEKQFHPGEDIYDNLRELAIEVQSMAHIVTC